MGFDIGDRSSDAPLDAKAWKEGRAVAVGKNKSCIPPTTLYVIKICDYSEPYESLQKN